MDIVEAALAQVEAHRQAEQANTKAIENASDPDIMFKAVRHALDKVKRAHELDTGRVNITTFPIHK